MKMKTKVKPKPTGQKTCRKYYLVGDKSVIMPYKRKAVIEPMIGMISSSQQDIFIFSH